MTKNLVVDAGALTLFFAGDERLKPYFDRILRRRAAGYVASVNLAEHYYKTCQKLGQQTAEARYYQARKLLTAVDTDALLTQAAGQEKCHTPSLSLADCFAVALTRRLHGLLLTTDAALATSGRTRAKLFEV
jgi:predicted nucleic acid-binding protein